MNALLWIAKMWILPKAHLLPWRFPVSFQDPVDENLDRAQLGLLPLGFLPLRRQGTCQSLPHRTPIPVSRETNCEITLKDVSP